MFFHAFNWKYFRKVFVFIFGSHFVRAVFYKENVRFPNIFVMRKSIQTESFPEIKVQMIECHLVNIFLPTLSSVYGTILSQPIFGALKTPLRKSKYIEEIYNSYNLNKF